MALYHRITASKLIDTFRQFRKDVTGNISILFAFSTIVLALFVGGAVDYTRWNAARSDMVKSLDAASLAVANLRRINETVSDDDLTEYAENFFRENFTYGNQLVAGWSVDFELDLDAVIRACLDGELDTLLLGIAGISELAMDECVEITPQGAQRIELALVLDVTGSMNDTVNNVSKIQSLKDAIDVMLDSLYQEGQTTSDRIQIGMVPFNLAVNAGGADSWLTSYEDTDANAVYHGSRFFHVNQNGVVQMNNTVNHYDLYDTINADSWRGCVEARPYPLDELDVPPNGTVAPPDITGAFDIPNFLTEDEMEDLEQGIQPDPPSVEEQRVASAFTNAPEISVGINDLTNANNLRWVPFFTADEPDCNDNDDCQGSPNIPNSAFVNGFLKNFTWRNFYPDDPDEDPDNPNFLGTHYLNRFYVDDRRYLHPSMGDNFIRYASIIEYFRDVLTGGETNTAFRNYLEDYGVEDFRWHEYIMRNGYVGYWNPVTQTYNGKYDLGVSLANADGPNGACPDAVLPLTNDRTVIENYKNALVARGGTNITNGVMWGWRLVSPGAPFTEAIGPGEEGPESSEFEDWQKAVVIMTDGENSVEFLNSSVRTHLGALPNAHGYPIEERLGDGVDTAPRMETELLSKMLRICQRMKDEDYLIYTIMFDLNDTATQQAFQACATQPGFPYFHNIDSGSQLQDAFGEIAQDLVRLHVSQ